MIVLGKNNHPLPSIGVKTHTISQFNSSYMEKNIITLSTTSNGTLSLIRHSCINSDTSLGCNYCPPWKEQSLIAFNWGDNTYNFAFY
jgi:hypothetical protein